MVVRNLSPEKAVTLVVVVLVVIIKFVFMNTTDKKTPEEKAEDFYKNREWDAYSFKQSVLQTYLAGHAAALSSGGSNCIGLEKLLNSLIHQSNGCGYHRGSERYILSGIIDYTKELIEEEKQKQAASQVIEDSENDYWKKRCEAAESLISVMDRPRNLAPYEDNEQFLLYRERNAAWEKSMHLSPSPKPIESDKKFKT